MYKQSLSINGVTYGDELIQVFDELFKQRFIDKLHEFQRNTSASLSDLSSSVLNYRYPEGIVPLGDNISNDENTEFYS